MSRALEAAIAGQPEQLARINALDLDQPRRVLDGRRLWLVGTGSSLHAADLGAMAFVRGGVDARACSCLDFAHGDVSVAAQDGVVVLSHTGETATARAALARARATVAAVVSVTGQGAGWPGAIETVPRERSQTYTVSYTAALLVLGRLAGEQGLEAAPAAAADALGTQLELESPARLLVLCGFGGAAVTAREGALKLREGARLPAEGFDPEYLLHGSAVPLGGEDGLLLLAPSSDPTGLTAGLGEAARAEGVAVAVLETPAGVSPLVAQIALTVPLQLLALRFSDRRGFDADEVIVGSWAGEGLWALGGP